MSKSTNQYFALELIFNSKLRVKVLRFLYRNYPEGVSVKDLARRVQEPIDLVRQELKNLQKISLIKKI